MINQLSEINLDYVKKIGAILILRNPEKLDIDRLVKFKSQCNRRNIDFFVSNSTKILFFLKSNNFYISAYNKKNYHHLKYTNSKINIIGSAHNSYEINEKIKQGCKQIILSRLYNTFNPYKKGFIGKVRFNLLSRIFDSKFIALGGINAKNFSHVNNLNTVGCAISSDKKKAGKYIPAFFKKY